MNFTLRLLCSPGFRGQRLSLNCFPRTVGSAPHQGACADLNRGCTWACRRLRRACSCSVRVSSASCGVLCASTSNVLRRASTGAYVLGASACSLCRTHCYRDRWLRFSPCRAHRLHLHLWWSQRAGFSTYAAPAPAVEYITSAQSVSYAAPARVLITLCQRLYPMLLIATAIGGFGSLPVEPIVCTFSCGGIHRDGTIGTRGTCTVYATPALVVMYIAPTLSVNVSPSPIVEHIAPTQAVSYVEEFYESSSHVRRRLLATRCGEQFSPVSLFVDTFHSCYKVSTTKLTHRQLLCSPRTVGNAPHQGACADLEMRKNKEVFSCCICARRLGASACGLCRTYCYRCVLKCDVSSTNVARRMSCCLVVNSSQSVMQCDAWIRKELHAECSAPAQVLEYSATESVAYAVPIATATGGFGSLPIEFSVCTCTCRGVHRASTYSVYAAPHR